MLKIPANETGTSYKELQIPQDYRIIGTLNTADKHFLFQLSDALKSRFAYIEVDIPRKEDYEKEVYYAMKNAISELRLKDYEDFILLDDTGKKVLPGRSNAEFYSRILQAYYFLDLVRVFKKLGTAILQLIYQNMLVAVKITKDAKLSLDNALTSTLIPQLENLSSASLGTIEALYNENIVQYFKDAYKSPNRQSYGEPFEKVLEYLQIGNYKTRAEEFSAGIMKIENDNIWSQIQTTFEDKKKNFELGLAQFKQGLTDLRRSAVV